MPERSPLHDITAAAAATFTEEAGWLVPAHFGDPAAEYRQARDSAVLFDVSHRGKIEMIGPDAVKLLHNLCTNDVARLPVGAGCEALLATAKAKVVARLLVYRLRSAEGVEDLWLDLDPGTAETTLKHLDRFLISEQVELADRTLDHAQFHVAGPQAPAILERTITDHKLADKDLGCVEVRFPTGTTSQLRRNDALGLPGFDLLCPRAHAEEAWQALRAAGVQPAGLEAYHILRVEAGTPLYGQDIDENNLAMELGRTAQAICYTKGCFPGQEPIVRARDLGHVNWSFRGLKVAGAQPVHSGARLFRDDKEVGRVTSAVFSPRLGKVVALGYVRRGHDAPGTTVEVDAGGERRMAEVSLLPFGS